MSKFITRVELHYANEADYETLHTAMKLQGFSRTIVGSDSSEYYLPTAQYSLIANLTSTEARDRAVIAAKSTGKNHAILVTEGASAWIGLKLVTKPQPIRR